MEFRSSLRWISCEPAVRQVRPVPFISLSGKVSVHTLYLWKCFPQQLFASMVSTTYKRLLAITLKRFQYKIKYAHRNACIKVAILYHLTLNDNIIDRFLGMFRKGTPIKVTMNYLQYCLSSLDENKRFVYSHAFHQAQWLQFQSLRTRDKSRIAEFSGFHLRGVLSCISVEPNEERVNRTLVRACSYLGYDDYSDDSVLEFHYSLGCSSETQDSSSEPIEGFDGDSEAWSSD